MTASLVTWVRYKVITLDTTTAEATVTAALETAQATVEEYLRRPLASASRTETLRFSVDGRLYPAATPITVPPTGLSLIGTSSVYGATPDASPSWPSEVDPAVPVVATITYTGGYDATTLPRTIENHIAWLAYQLTHASVLAGLPAGVTAASVGDVSVTFAEATGPASELSSAARRDLRGWRRRFV